MLKDKLGNTLSRSEGEAIMKSRSSVVISICAALLALASMLSNSNSGRILNDTLNANDTWAFYQAKSIKQGLAENSIDILDETLQIIKEPDIRDDLQKKIADNRKLIARYESDTTTNEGKKELTSKARSYEADREIAKNKSTWFGAASAALQIAIVLASSSILAVSMPMLCAGAAIGTLGTLFLVNAVFMFVQLPL